MKQKQGFTLIELLVVIAIIGILSSLAFGTYGHLTRKAEQQNARDLCQNVKTAWTRFHSDMGVWPTTFSTQGVQSMTPKMCRVLGESGLLDVLYDDDAGKYSSKQIESDPELKYGLLSPIGMKLFRKKASDSEIEDARVFFVLDSNEDGIIDSSDGFPAYFTRGSKVVRADVAVWCWPEGGQNSDGETYAQTW